jgi:hypothetical protein
MNYTKTITSILIAGAILSGGIYYYTNELGEPTSNITEVELMIEDTGKNLNQLRIVPSEIIEVFPEPAFILNDIIFQIMKDHCEEDMSQRCVDLRTLRSKVEEKLQELPTPEGGRVSEI